MAHADIILKSNYIFDGINPVPFQGAVAVQGNKILDVGSFEQLKHLADASTIIKNYGDQLIMPGFIDNHTHLDMTIMGASQYQVNLFGAKSEEECISRILAFRSLHPDIERISAYGWSLDQWGENAKNPTKKSLDAAIGDIPVYMQHLLCHAAWLNSKALEEGDISRTTKFKSSMSCAEKDAYGELTGIILETEALTGALKHSTDLPEKVKMRAVKAVLAQMAQYGITACADMATGTYPTGNFGLYYFLKKLDHDLPKGLPLRLHFYPSLGYDGNLDMVEKLRLEFQVGNVLFCGLKQFIDGIPCLHSACLLEPYNDMPETRGTPIYEQEVYNETVSRANERGFDVRMHAIGDGAVRIALNAYEFSKERGTDKNVINTIEHIDLITQEDIARMAELGTFASMQALHIQFQNPFSEPCYGKKRLAKESYLHRDLLKAGIPIVMGTDHPDFNPFRNIHAAITRCEQDGTPLSYNPEQAMTLPEVLKSYTYDSAAVLHRSHELGALKKGYLADLVVINGPVFNEQPEEILNRKPILTMLDGNVIFEEH